MSETGRVVWITGASSGIGAALARALGAAGWGLILSGRRVAALEAVAASTGAPALVLPFEATDLASLPGGGGSGAGVAGGGIDMLVNNAGVSQRSLALDTELATYRAIMETDFFAPLRADAAGGAAHDRAAVGADRGDQLAGGTDRDGAADGILRGQARDGGLFSRRCGRSSSWPTGWGSRSCCRGRCGRRSR